MTNFAAHLVHLNKPDKIFERNLMKTMGKFVKFYLGFTFGIAAVACDYQGQPVPVNGIIKETMTVEYDFISGFDAGSDNRAFPEIRDNVKQAYIQTGTTFLPYRDDTHTLPPYPNDPNNWFPHDDPVALRDYAETHRHSIDGQSMNYHFLSVNYARINRQASWLHISGVAVDGPDNQTPTPVSERFSIIFWGDILTWGDLTPGGSGGDQSIREVVVLVSAHELAHQRIQLTHFSVSPQFHNQAQTYCALRTLVSEVPAFYRLRPEFCNDDDTNIGNSCRDWLKQANP